MRNARTKIEVRFERALVDAGVLERPERNVLVDRRSKLRPDLLFRKSRVAVLVNGCFFHGCARHGPRPGDKAYARALRAQANDRAAIARYVRLGFAPVIVWECDLNEDERGEAARVADTIRAREPVGRLYRYGGNR